MGLESDINKYLETMHKQDPMGKGTVGEQAALRICEKFYQMCGGILYHSYTYKADPELQGNVKASGGQFYLERVGSVTEIDVLYATEFKIFPIEVKAYKASKITLTDSSIAGCNRTEKSPVHQNEMHCRHLYPHLVRALPNGESKYIEPIVCFVDRCELVDNRSEAQKEYIKVVTLNQLESCIAQLNRPLEYRIDLDTLEVCLNDACTSYEKLFRLRRVR